jgi:hypothetical protein
VIGTEQQGGPKEGKTMKNATMTMMIAAAALAVVAGSASAQTYKAEIPMTFKAGSVLMTPGSYRVDVNEMSRVIRVANEDTGKTVALLPLPGGDVPKTWRAAGKPVFAFTCAEGSCSLSRMWNGKDASDLRFSAPKSVHGENVAQLLVTLDRAE